MRHIGRFAWVFGAVLLTQPAHAHNCKVTAELLDILYLGASVGTSWSFSARAVVNGVPGVIRVPGAGILAAHRVGRPLPANLVPRLIVGPVVVGRKGATVNLTLATTSVASEDDTLPFGGLPHNPAGDDTGTTGSSGTFTIKECGTAEPLEITWVDTVNVIEDDLAGQQNDTPRIVAGTAARMTFIYSFKIDP